MRTQTQTHSTVTQGPYTIDASRVSLVSAQTSNFICCLAIVEEGLAISTSSADELTIRRETNDVHKTSVALHMLQIPFT